MRKFNHGRVLCRLLVAGSVVFVARQFPGWWFAHMTADEHLEAAKAALQEQSYAECLRHVNALPPAAPDTVALRRKLIAAQDAAGQKDAVERQQAAIARQAEVARNEARQIAVGELQQNLRNLGYDVTVDQTASPEQVTIESRGFDEPDTQLRFVEFLRGGNSPAAAACSAGIQTVRLKGPGLFFGRSDTYSLDCVTK